MFKVKVKVTYLLRNFENLQRFFMGEPWPWRPWTSCPQGVFGGEHSFKKMSAGGRLCTLQENPHFWVLTIKVWQPDGIWSVYLVFRQQRQGRPLLPRPRRTPDAVNVSLDKPRAVVADDVVDVGHVDAPGHRVRRDKHVNLALGKLSQHRPPRHVREQRGKLADAHVPELLEHAAQRPRAGPLRDEAEDAAPGVLGRREEPVDDERLQLGVALEVQFPQARRRRVLAHERRVRRDLLMWRKEIIWGVKRQQRCHSNVIRLSGR